MDRIKRQDLKMRKTFNCFVACWFLLAISYFISTFVYGMFFTDKIQARADTLEQVYQQEFSEIQTISEIKKSRYYRGGYRLDLVKDIVVRLSYEDLIKEIKRLGKEKEWMVKEEHEYDNDNKRNGYYYFVYSTKKREYNLVVSVYKEGEDDHLTKARIMVYFNDFYEKHGL